MMDAKVSVPRDKLIVKLQQPDPRHTDEREDLALPRSLEWKLALAMLNGEGLSLISTTNKRSTSGEISL